MRDSASNAGTCASATSALPHPSHRAGYPVRTITTANAVADTIVGYASFLVVIALALVGVGFAQVQAFAALDGSPDTVRTLHESRFVMVNLSAAPTIVSATAFAMAMVRTGFPARWLGWGSALVALAHVPALLALSRTGVRSPTGGLAQLGPLVFLVWVLCVSVTLLVGRRELPAN